MIPFPLDPDAKLDRIDCSRLTDQLCHGQKSKLLFDPERG
jgi:hypothetical protein